MSEKPVLPINKYSIYEAKSLIDQAIVEVYYNIIISKLKKTASENITFYQTWKYLSEQLYYHLQD